MDKKNEIPHCFNRAVLTFTKHTVSDRKKKAVPDFKVKKKAVKAITVRVFTKRG